MKDDLRLGALITSPQHRDAIHIAVAPVEASQILHPGDHVGLASDGKVTKFGVTHIGIIDPYLTGSVLPGQRCWLFLYPSTITSLRHEWMHPAFEAMGAQGLSIQEARAKMAELGRRLVDPYGNPPHPYDVDTMLEIGDQVLARGSYWFGFNDGPEIMRKIEDEYWPLYEILRPGTQRPAPEKEGWGRYSCAC